MNASLKTALAIAGLAIATQAAAQVTFYEREGFEGRSFTTQGALDNLNGQFGDRAQVREQLGSVHGRVDDLRP